MSADAGEGAGEGGERRLAYQPLIHFYVMGANEKSAAPANFDFIHKLPPATHAFLRTKQGAHARWMPLRSECVIFYLKEREMEKGRITAGATSGAIRHPAFESARK